MSKSPTIQAHTFTHMKFMEVSQLSLVLVRCTLLELLSMLRLPVSRSRLGILENILAPRMIRFLAIS